MEHTEKITLEDVVNLTSEALLQKITSQNEGNQIQDINKLVNDNTVSEIQSINPVVPPDYIPVIDTPEIAHFNLNSLRGFFPKGTTFKKDDAHTVGDYTVRIIGFIPSANRVKFKVDELGTSHSMPLKDLTGEASDFPYKKGDKVLYNGIEYEVKRINPANSNIVLLIDSNFKYVKTTKVTPV